MDSQYYYIDGNGQTLGPVDEAYILDLRANGILNDATHLNIVGSPGWQNLGELFPSEDVPPPPPPPPPPPEIELTKPQPSKNLLVEKNGENFGPYSVEEAKQYLESGQLSRTDDACWQGTSEWLSLERLLASEVTPLSKSEPAHPKMANPYGDSNDNEAPLDVDDLLVDFKQRYEVILAENENKHMGPKVFFGSEIPYEKLIGAYAGYAFEARSSNDLNLVLLDDTLSGNSKKGFLATSTGVYFKNMLEKGSLINWGEIQSIQSKTGFLGSKVLINHNQKIELQPWHGKILPSLLEDLFRFLLKNAKLLGKASKLPSNSSTDIGSGNNQYHPDLDIGPEIKQAYSRHFLMMEEMLSEGEIIHALARGVGGFGKAGKEIMAATNKRILVFRQIVNLLLPQFENEEFYWSDIESVKVISGMMMSGIVLRTRGGEYSMKNVSSADAAGFAAFTTSHLQQLKSS